MIYNLPLFFKNRVVIPDLPNKSFRFADGEGGKDSKKIRFTNIIGFSKEKHDFLKKCPMCGEIKPSEEFGLRKSVGRDQSDCMNCRGKY